MPDAWAPREAPFSEKVRVKNGPDCGRSSHLLRSYCDTVRHCFQGFPRIDASSPHTTKPPSQRQGRAPGGSAHVGKQTDTHAARTTGRSGEPEPGGSPLALVQSAAFLLALVSSHGMEAAAHTHVCPPVMSKPVALGFLATRRPAVFPPTPRHVRGQSAFVPETPCHSETGLGQACYPQRAAGRGGRGPRPAGILLECLGSSSGVCGVRQDTRGMDGVRYLPASGWHVRERLGNPHSRGHYRTDSCSVLRGRQKRHRPWDLLC